jgi:ribosomal protein S18 acetylase RimI-like enzyme
VSVVITPLASRHPSQVASLHLRHLPTGFQGLPGQRLLGAYYAAVTEGAGASGFVAEQEGRVVGYVCGVWSPSALLSTLLRRHWRTWMFWGVAHAALHPGFVPAVASRVRGASAGAEVPDGTYELRPIVVAQPARGTGVAADLVAALLADARRRGFHRMHLIAKADNAAAQAFYRKVGFHRVGSPLHRPGGAWARYERIVDEEAGKIQSWVRTVSGPTGEAV